jgi:hypothetical protein
MSYEPPDTNFSQYLFTGTSWTCSRCGLTVYGTAEHVCPPGIYSAPIPQPPTWYFSPPPPDYTPLLTRIAEQLGAIKLLIHNFVGRERV